MSARLAVPSTIIILLIMASVVLAPYVPRARAAATGVVCIQDPGTPGVSPFNCDAGAPHLTGPSPTAPQISPTQIRIGVFIENSTGFNGFDITLLANHAVLLPSGVDLAGSVLAAPTIALECNGGQSPPPIHSVCPPTDTVDTIELAATSQSLTIAPTTGLLFTAIYNITGTTPLSGITVGFQTGCTGTSAPGGTCITIIGGTSQIPETVQTGNFNDSALPPWVSVTAKTNTAGPTFPTIPASISLTFTPQNGWPTQGHCFEVSGCQLYLSSSSPPPVTVSLSAPVINASSPVTVTVSADQASTGLTGNYSITIFAEYSTFAFTQIQILTGTLVAAFTFKLIVNDYSLQIQPAGTVTLVSGHSVTRQLSINSINGFSGNVTVSTRAMSPTTGLTVTYNGASSTTVKVTPSPVANVTMGFSSSTPGKYLVQTKGAVGSYFKTTILTVNVTAFQSQTQTLSFNGVIFQVTSSLENDTARNRVSGTASITVTNSTTGQTIFTHSYVINVTYPGSMRPSRANSLSFILSVASLNYAILCNVDAPTAPTLQCFATYNPDVFNQGTVNINDLSALIFAYGSTPGSSRWNPRFDFDLSGTIGIVDIGIVLFYYGWPIIT